MRMNVITATACIAAALAAPAAAQIGPSPSLGPIFFDKGSAALTDRARAQIGQLAAAAAPQQPTFMVTGYADRSGPDHVNMALSQRRAQAVADYLISRGVAERCVRTNAWGEMRPPVETADGVDEPANRRVEITMEPGCTG